MYFWLHSSYVVRRNCIDRLASSSLAAPRGHVVEYRNFTPKSASSAAMTGATAES
jgi:hypothetical protein